ISTVPEHPRNLGNAPNFEQIFDSTVALLFRTIQFAINFDTNPNEYVREAGQLASLRRNSRSSKRYLKALRRSMKITGTSSVNCRRNCSSESTSISLHLKPPRRCSFVSVSLTISHR